MTNPTPSLLVAVEERAAVIKVSGRVNFATSVTFKRLVGELRDRGYARFVLDLSECVTMDSTFLGVLAGTALSLGQGASLRSTNGEVVVRPPDQAGLCLVNASQRVADLIDNLGIAGLFPATTSTSALPSGPALAPASEVQPSRQELSETCLEAHRLLMDLNPGNVPKFKDVTQFLAEDLKKLTAQNRDV